MQTILMFLTLISATCAVTPGFAEEKDLTDHTICGADIAPIGTPEIRTLRDGRSGARDRTKPIKNADAPPLPAEITSLRVDSQTTLSDEWTVSVEHCSGFRLAVTSATGGLMAFGILSTSGLEERRYTLLCTDDRLSLCALHRGEKWELSAAGLELFNCARNILCAVAYRNRTSVLSPMASSLLFSLRTKIETAETSELIMFSQNDWQAYLMLERAKFAIRRRALDGLSIDCRNTFAGYEPLNSLARFVTADCLLTKHPHVVAR